MPASTGPDWALVGAVAAILTAIGALVAHAAGIFKTRATAQQERQNARDKHATDNATLTLDSVFKLVNELQQERDRCAEEIRRLDEKVVRLEAEIVTLHRKIETILGTTQGGSP